MKKIFLVSALAVAASFGTAQSFYEGFENGPTGWGGVTQFGLTGGEDMSFGSGTWHAINVSNPLGTSGWFSNRTIWPAYVGIDQLCANFNATTGATGQIDNYMMSPVRTFNNGDKIRFWTRTATGSIWPDRVRLVWSGNGASSNPADFTTVLTEVNPAEAQFAYPEEYTAFEVTISGLAAPTSGRFAFNYFVANGGPLGVNSNFISIDSVNYGVNGVYAEEPTVGGVPTAVDLGSVDTNTSPVTVSIPLLAASEIKWYKFTLSGAVSLNASTWLDVWTNDSGSGSVDSEIGVYDSTGALMGDDDDSGAGLFSFLSYGSGSGNQVGDSIVSSGQDLDLAAGTYYLAVGRFNVTYGAANFLVTSTGAATTADFNLFLASNLPPAANQTLSGTLNLNDTVFGGAYTRTITGTVKQGATTVGTITVSGINASSFAFSGSIPASATGAATIEWDGSSFLLRKTNITLTGSNLAVGTVSMQNGDVDGSGEVDAADIDEVIANFGSGDDINSDVDVSGEVDAADIDIVIANFGGTDD